MMISKDNGKSHIDFNKIAIQELPDSKLGIATLGTNITITSGTIKASDIKK